MFSLTLERHPGTTRGRKRKKKHHAGFLSPLRRGATGTSPAFVSALDILVTKAKKRFAGFKADVQSRSRIRLTFKRYLVKTFTVEDGHRRYRTIVRMCDETIKLFGPAATIFSIQRIFVEGALRTLLPHIYTMRLWDRYRQEILHYHRLDEYRCGIILRASRRDGKTVASAVVFAACTVLIPGFDTLSVAQNKDLAMDMIKLIRRFIEFAGFGRRNLSRAAGEIILAWTDLPEEVTPGTNAAYDLCRDKRISKIKAVAGTENSTYTLTHARATVDYLVVGVDLIVVFIITPCSKYRKYTEAHTE